MIRRCSLLLMAVLLPAMALVWLGERCSLAADSPAAESGVPPADGCLRTKLAI